jgi:hypothetical protein
VENHVCLSRGEQVTGVTWWAATRIETVVGDPVQRIGDGEAQVGYSMARRSRGQVTLCVVAPCTRKRGARVSLFGIKTKVNSLSVVWPQNH